jgi:penicillin-binding protein 2
MAIDRRATRLGVLALVGLGLFSLLGVRLWFLQTVKADELQETITIARTRTVRLAPERGRIVDIDGRILADNERVLSVGIDWDVLRKKSERDDIFTRLSGWIDVPVETMEENFDPSGRTVNPFLPYVVRSDIDEPTAIAILERAEDFPGVEILTEWKRVYPYGQHAAHVVGYMGAITEEQLDDFEAAGYLLDERVGQFGVERSLEPILHGTWGYKVLEVDAANRPVRVVEEVPPINGFDVQLTIDLEAQQYLEQTLETTLKARRGQTAENPIVKKPDGSRQRMDLSQGDRVAYKAPAASGLIMDYTTGDVLAMASYPGFDNRWFEAGISGDKFAEVFPITDDPDKSILVNRAVQGRYNLGSTFKPFTAYAALSTGLLAPGDYYVDQGTYTLSNESVSSDKCVSGLVKCEYKNATCGNGLPCRYGGVNVESALAVSSDTFFYRIGEQIMLRNDNQPILQEQVRLFGFGADTGIELPFEFDGTVPDRELKRIYAERGVISETEGERYYVGDNVQLAIGQGLLSATPLQLATGYATIANGGFVLKPSVVRQIWNPGLPDAEQVGYVDFSRGTVFEDRAAPELIRQIPMPDSIRTPIVNGLRRVIYGPGVDSDFYHKTTGEHLFADYPRTNDAIPLAGKTGTAQGAGNYPWNDSSAFTAFSTDEERPWVVSAYLEKAGYGSQAAAPVVKCTFLALSGLSPMEPVDLADPLDLSSELAAQPQSMPDAFRPGGPQCWNSLFDNGVLTDEAGVD